MGSGLVRYNKMGCSTSEVGQTRTLDNVRVMSVVLLIADSRRTVSYVRSGPIADSCIAAIFVFVSMASSYSKIAP